MPIGQDVELIYDATCPNVDAARQQLRDALTRAGRPPIWTEWERAAPDSPAYVRRFASPTVLVGGRDVAGGGDLDAGDGCRVYQDDGGTFSPAPSAQTIFAALRST